MGLFGRKNKAERERDAWRDNQANILLGHGFDVERELERSPHNKRVQAAALSTRYSVMVGFEAMGRKFTPYWRLAIDLPPADKRRGIDHFMCAGEEDFHLFGY